MAKNTTSLNPREINHALHEIDMAKTGIDESIGRAVRAYDAIVKVEENIRKLQRILIPDGNDHA